MQQAMLLDSQAARTNGACNKKTAARHTIAAHFFLSQMCAFTMRSEPLQNTFLGYAKRGVSKNNLQRAWAWTHAAKPCQQRFVFVR